MKLSCPACGAVASLDVLLGHEGAREAVMAALALPAPLGKLLIQYVALFRPASRNLSMDRLANLLTELQPMIAAARIERNGRTHAAPLEYWQLAITEMLAKRDRLGLPLKNHGYLLTIIESLNLKAEAGAESKRENSRAGITPIGVQRHDAASTAEAVHAKPRGTMPEGIKAQLDKQLKRKGAGDE